jgi:hypothetical protein
MTESTLTISIRPNFFCHEIAQSVLPEAVGPNRKITGSLDVCKN